MNIENSQISLTYSLRGESLCMHGDYSVAELSTEANERYTKTDGDTMMIKSITKPSKTIKEPVYSNATQHVMLGSSFIEHALERPKKPHNRDSVNVWNIYHNWHKMSINVKLNEAIKQYVKDMNGLQFEWELL